MTNSKLTLTSPQQKNGAIYEQMACQYLQSQGLTLVAGNWLQTKVGEIDLIMIEHGKFWDVLVFIEVRSRKVGKYGDAVASVTKAKQKKLIKTARFFLQAHPHFQSYECRFDVLAFSQKVSDSISNKLISNTSTSHQSILMANQNRLPVNELNQHSLLIDNVAPYSDYLDTSLHCSCEWIQGAFVANAWA